MSSSRPYREIRNVPLGMHRVSSNSIYGEEEDPFPYHLKHTDQLLWCIDRWSGGHLNTRKGNIELINRLAPGLLQDPRRSAFDKCHIINGILGDYYQSWKND